MDVGVPHVILLFVDPKFCECAMCHQTIGHIFNLHSCNLIKIAIEFLDDIMPN